MKKKINLRRIIILFVAFTLVAGYFLKLSSKSLATWYDDNYLYRQKITIGNTGAADTNKKIKFDIDTATLITAGKMQSIYMYYGNRATMEIV